MARSDFQFFFPFRVRYSETDAQGIVFYSNYLIFFDTAVYEYFRALPFNFLEHVAKNAADFHTAHVSVDFHVPARFDDCIEIGVRTTKIGNTSLIFDLEVYLYESSKLMLNGRLVWVNTDQTTRRPVSLPEILIQKIRALEKTL